MEGTTTENSFDTVDHNEGNNRNTVAKCADSEVVQGWLSKRSNLMHSWKMVYVRLSNTELMYGKSEDKDDKGKSLNLDGANIEECKEASYGQHCFSIKPKNNKRVHYFRADTEEDLRRWLEAIFYARIGKGKGTDNSEACVIQ